MGNITLPNSSNALVQWQNPFFYESTALSTVFNASVYNSFEEEPGEYTRTTIQDFPSDYRGKVDILHFNKWKRVDYKAILSLQERNLTDTHLNQLLKTNLNVETMAKIATLSNAEGAELVTYILETAQNGTYLLETSQENRFGFLGYIMRIPRLISCWFQANQAPKPKTEEESNDEIIATLPAVEYPSEQFGSKFESRGATTPGGCGTAFHVKPFILGAVIRFDSVEKPIRLSAEDCAFLKKRGLTDYHLREFLKIKIYVHEMMGFMLTLPNLDGDLLFYKIINSKKKIPETIAFQKWISDPTKGCSRKEKKYPKALVLVSKYYLDAQKKHASINKNVSDQNYDRDHLEQLNTVYRVCVEEFSNLGSFASVVKKHSRTDPIKVVIIKTHGGQDYMKLSPHLNFILGNSLNNNFPRDALSYLTQGAQVILMSCSAGKGKNKVVNLSNLFLLNAPPGVTVVAPTDEYANFQVIFTIDEKGSLQVRFWNYDRVALKKNAPLREAIQDITYEANSSTELDLDVIAALSATD